MEKPKPFITLNEETGHFELGAEAAEYISTVDKPVAIVAIAGLYRTGKSFIMNQLAGKTNGFNVGATIEACTKGLWVWEVDGSQFPEFPHLSKYSLLLIDTEGLGSTNQTETYDVQIFSLALLLSSYFVYNSVGSIDETALDRLSLVVELTKHIRAQADTRGDNKETDPSQLKIYFPSFMWLVRDFTLELEVDGKAISSRQYLENALKPVAGDPKRVAAKNKIRECITQFFVDRDCFTMIRPVAEERKLQRMAQLSMDDLREEYREQLLEFKSLILNNIEPKKIHGDMLNGGMLVELAKNYIKAINEGGVPVISSAWESVVLLECKKAMDLSRNLYKKKLEEALATNGILEESELIDAHREAHAAALRLLHSKAVGSEKEKYDEELHQFVYETLAQVREKNAKESTDVCTKLVESVFEQHLPSSLAIESFDALHQQFAITVSQYEKQARGPSRHEVLMKFLSTQRKLEDAAERVATHLVNRNADKYERELEEVRARAKAEYDRLDQLMKSEVAKHEQQYKDLMARSEQDRARLERMMEQTETRYKQELDEQKARSDKEYKRIEGLLADKDDQYKEAKENNKQLVLAKTALEKKLEAQQAAIEELNKKTKQMTKDNKTLTDKLDALTKEKQLADKLNKELEEEIRRVRDDLTRTQAEKSNLTREKETLESALKEVADHFEVQIKDLENKSDAEKRIMLDQLQRKKDKECVVM